MRIYEIEPNEQVIWPDTLVFAVWLGYVNDRSNQTVGTVRGMIVTGGGQNTLDAKQDLKDRLKTLGVDPEDGKVRVFCVSDIKEG